MIRLERAFRISSSGFRYNERVSPAGFPSQHSTERWPSGLRRRFAKPLYGLKPVSGVRIPPSPPVLSLTALLLLRFRVSRKPVVGTFVGTPLPLQQPLH